MDLRGWEMQIPLATPLSGLTVTVHEGSLAHPNVGATIATAFTDASGMWVFTGLTNTAKDVKVVYGNGQVKWYKGMARLSAGVIFFDEAPTADYYQVVGQASVAAPGVSTVLGRLYMKTDGKLYHRYENGAEVQVFSSGDQISSAFLTDRVRSLYVPASQLDVGTGTPTAGILNGWKHWIFSATVDQTVNGGIQIPLDLASGNLTIKAVWSATSGEAANNFKVAVQARGIASGGAVDTATFPGSGASALSIAGPAASATLYVTTITTAANVGIVAGNPSNLDFTRYGAEATDTCANVFNLYGLIVEYLASM